MMRGQRKKFLIHLASKKWEVYALNNREDPGYCHRELSWKEKLACCLSVAREHFDL
jgi:hypothetical protein